MNRFLTTAAAALCAAAAFAQTNLVVVTTDGATTSYPLADVAGVIFEEAPDYVPMPELLSAVYTSYAGNGLYTIQFGTEIPDEYGDPAEIGGQQVSLTLTSDLSEDRYDAILPSGFYRPGNGTQRFTFDVTKAAVWTRLEQGFDGVASSMITDGYVDVRCDDRNYEVRMSLISLFGEVFEFIYEGPIEFGIGMSEFEPLGDVSDLQIEGAQARFYGNWFYPFADDVTLEFYTGEFDSNGQQIDGYWFSFDMYMPLSDDPASVRTIADGVYRVEPRSDIYESTYLPYTFRKGYITDFLGTPLTMGSFITRIERNGRRFLGLDAEGTLTVSNGGKHFEINLVTADGATVQAEFNGTPYVENRYDGAREERPYSTITADRQFRFESDTQVYYFNEGPTILPDLNTVLMLITEPDMATGDFMNLQFLSDATSLTDGTYSVNLDFENNSVLPGALDYGGNVLFSWFGNLDSEDESGVQTEVAAISGGSFTVSTAADGRKTFVLDLVADNGYKVTGTFTVKVTDISPAPQAPAAPAMLKSAAPISPLKKLRK